MYYLLLFILGKKQTIYSRKYSNKAFSTAIPRNTRISKFSKKKECEPRILQAAKTTVKRL
jgi:hypothetical protein